MSSSDPNNPGAPIGRWHDVDPMFDGHLEKPLLKMTVQERLDWIDEMMKFRHWSRTGMPDRGSETGPDTSMKGKPPAAGPG